MAFEVNITPEDIETLVKDSLLKAGLGKTIADSVNKLLSGYNSPVEEALKRYMGQVAADLIRDKFADNIKEAIAVTIEAKLTKELIQKMVEATSEKLERAIDNNY